jgi:hypothetical protein
MMRRMTELKRESESSLLALAARSPDLRSAGKRRAKKPRKRRPEAVLITIG